MRSVEGTESVVRPMSPMPFQVAYLSTAPAKAACCTSSSCQEGNPAWEPCLPASPGHDHTRASAWLGDTAGSWLPNCASNTGSSCQEDENMGTGCSWYRAKGRGWAGWEVLVLADTFFVSGQKLLSQESGPFWGPGCLFGNHPTRCIHSNLKKLFTPLLFLIDLKPWSSHSSLPVSLS